MANSRKSPAGKKAAEKAGSSKKTKNTRNTRNTKTAKAAESSASAAKKKKTEKEKNERRQIEIIDKPDRADSGESYSMKDEVITILLLALAILMMLANFGVAGEGGDIVSNVMFGLFGSAAYIFPLVLFFGIVFVIVNKNNGEAVVKAISFGLLFLILSMFFELAWNNDFDSRSSSYTVDRFWGYAVEFRRGGGFIGGHMFDALMKMTGSLGAVIIMIAVTVICLVIITGKSLIRFLGEGGKDAARRVKDRVDDTAAGYAEERQNVEMHRERPHAVGDYMEKTRIDRDDPVASDDMHEVKPDDDIDLKKLRENLEARALGDQENEVPKESAAEVRPHINEIHELSDEKPLKPRVKDLQEEAVHASAKRKVAPAPLPGEIVINDAETADYRLPDPSMLTKGNQSGRNSSRKEQMETAERLKNTLASFGVNVTMTDISQGPTVTRYEMLPDAGVKVSRILSLTDDIKLNLAAESIRIEAPIPGKAAIGIEVPNREVTPVMLHDLIVSDEFQAARSKISFAVGKDIGGKTVVFDIAKMPHVLIAGATGSGKSVCINTIIMSILFKARPDEVKMIMIDPKVVELSIYNGIPHLMIPVVTDPQKAAGALNWGVIEMDKRYNQFAEMRVRDLRGYNAMAEKEHMPLMPQIVIIVDELADLMMVAKNDVETSICRLAQKARAAGIHIIIATQRPSVDVITGLIKANMPSRVAFTVTSGTDSRTILDMVGAEKLLGKGDMLFYPTGYPKPARIQGAFVSDEEVEKVASFCRDQNKEQHSGEDIMAQIESAATNNSSATASAASGGPDSDEDDLFMQAAEFAVELDKETISIGLLQRKFRLGFNRAARIMDQLSDAGIVGEDMGTKGRRIVMTSEKFEEFKEEHV